MKTPGMIHMKLTDILMDSLPDGHPWDGNIKGLVDRLIENGVSVQKWISVYDTLPKHKMKCIVHSKMGRTFTTWYNPESYRFFPHFAKYNITHWMPLPKAPKED